MSEAQRDAYIARRQEEQKQALDWVKREVSLVDFATSKLGWEVNKKKTSKRHIVLKHPQHGTIIVPGSPMRDSGYHVFSWSDKKGGGTLVNLLRLEGWDWQEIRALSGQITAQKPVASLPVAPPRPENYPEQQTELAQAKFNSLKHQNGPSYLERRGIDPSVYKDFKHFRTTGNQAIFKLYKVFENIEGHLCSTISYYYDREGNSKKYFQKGLPRGLSVFRDAGPIERVVVTESPIDALSFKQSEALKNPQSAPGTLYVSTCGSLSRDLFNSLHHLFQQSREEGRHVIVARDNDQAGKTMSREIALLASNNGLSVRVSIPPKGKDWNEYLAHLRGGRQVSEQLILLTPGDHAPAYKDTLLEKINVPEAACKGFTGYAVTADHISFPLYASVEDMKFKKATGLYQFNVARMNRYEMQGTKAGLVVLPSEQPARRVVVTDHPLDIFLHREQANSVIPYTQTTYISTCGQDAREVQKPLKAFLEDQKCAHVTLYMPSASAEKLQAQLGSEMKIDGQVKPLTAHAIAPIAKAFWHDPAHSVLLNRNTPLSGHDQSDWVEAPQKVQQEKTNAQEKNTVNNAIAIHPIQKSFHKTPAYERTLLEALEISEKACRSLQGYEAGEKQVTFPLYEGPQAVQANQPTGTYKLRLEEKGLESVSKSPGLVVLPAARAKTVVVTTDPLDIFLHRAEQQASCKWQKPPATTYISTCGQEVSKISAPLKALLAEQPSQSVLLYMNDQEAQTLQKQLMTGSEKTAHYPPPKALWHPDSQQVTYDLQKIMRQEQEEWEPIKPKRRKGKGRSVSTATA